VRVHNYGEPFLDRELVEKVRYAKQKGIAEVGMISNGSLITGGRRARDDRRRPRCHQHQRRRRRQRECSNRRASTELRRRHRQHPTLAGCARESARRTRS
jgi:hypothetical protein